MSELSSKERNALPDSQFGLPKERKFPLNDPTHVSNAAARIEHAPESQQKTLAKKILAKAHKYGMDTSDWDKTKQIAQEEVDTLTDPAPKNQTTNVNSVGGFTETDLERQVYLNSIDTANSFRPVTSSVETADEQITVNDATRIAALIRSQVIRDSKPPTGNQNCQLCTWCAEAQFRGINVLPRPIYSPRDPALEIVGEGIVKNPQQNSIRDKNDVINQVTNAGDGARFYCHVNWNGSAGGHEFLLLNLEGSVYLMDAQQGFVSMINGTGAKSYFDDINYKNSYIARLDDHELNEELLREYNDPSKTIMWDPALDIPYMKENGLLSSLESEYTMRNATMSDLEFVYQSELETVGENKDDPKVQKYIRDDARDSIGHTKIIVVNGEDVGVYQAYATDYYGMCGGDEDWWYLAHIYIKPEYRSFGIGSAIIKKDISEHDKILLQVMKSNTRAKKLYESLGFVVDKENNHGGIVMRIDKTKAAPKPDHVQEYTSGAALMTVQNQLRNILGNSYTFMGSGTIPKFNVKSNAKPSISFDITVVNGTNAECTPLVNGIPDMLHKKRGIALMRAASVLAEFIKTFVASNSGGSVQESANIIESGYFDKYKDDVLGFNDEGMAVMKKCDCGGKISIAMKGEPIYTCESCGKTYGCVQFQEGAIQENAQFVTIAQVSLNYFGHSVTVPVETLTDSFDNDTVYEDLNQMIPDIITKSKDIFNKACFEEAKLLMISYDKEGDGDNVSEIEGLKMSDAMNAIKPTLILFDYTDSGTPFFLVDCEFKYDDEHGFGFLINKNIEITEMGGGLGGLLITDRMLEKPLITQEGAFQDIKNGVNPYSDDLVFHVSMDKHIDGQVWQPRVPDYLDPYNPEDTGFEDNTTPRICFSTSIEGALNGITVNLQRQSADTFDKMYVYVPEKPWKKYKHKTNKQLVKDKLVYDANVTREVWIMEPVRMKLYGVIRVDQIADAKRKSVVPTSKGQKDTRNYFTYKWHWIVKPKVLKKATKFDYSPERVIDDLCVDVKKFKYGLIKDGRLMTGNVSDADYDKYWVFHSGEMVDQAGGGNCYDMVEYEAGYLEAFGVAYKKYFINATNLKNQTLGTHTICVVPHNGKFIYIEQAFKRVVDEWGYERKKEFDKLNDVFEYVAECMSDYHGQPIDFGVWDYTTADIDYGTPIKNFQEWIMTKCKMIYDGEVENPTVKQENYEMYAYDDDIIDESVTDIFIELGDKLFYVSEYHNALFDDPDAYDEAINEFGILLDSYDDDNVIQEVASVGPYDEYLKKHNYDPKTNTIEDPDRPGKRVSAGKIGSEKERRRMNKFLRENGYDPRTETIQTDIPDPRPGQPSRKKRVKFTIDAHNDALMRHSDLSINMPPKSIAKKPIQSNQTFKHEEGHVNQFGNPVKTDIDKQRMNAAKDYVRTLDRSKISSDHDLAPTEYDADAYGAEHNRYNKRGTSAYSALRSLIGDQAREVSKFEKSVNKSIRKKGIDKNSFEAQQQKLVDILIKHPNHPGPNASEIEWAEYLKKVYPTPEIFDAYIAYNNKKLELTNWKKAERAKIKEGYKKYAVDSDEMIELEENYSRERKKRELEIEQLGSKCLKAFDIIEDISDLSALSPDNLKRHVQELIDKRLNAEISGTIRNKGYRDPAEMLHAHEQRARFATQQFNAAQAKQRQLSKEQLKQQIASGQLTGTQAAKAERKIQRIEAFEARKQQTQPQIKQDVISVANQPMPKPTVKKEESQ